MPARKKKQKENTAHDKVGDSDFNFELPGESLIALHNALAFTLSHKDVYGQEIEICDHCLDAMDVLRRRIGQILEYSDALDVKKQKLLN